MRRPGSEDPNRLKRIYFMFKVFPRLVPTLLPITQLAINGSTCSTLGIAIERIVSRVRLYSPIGNRNLRFSYICVSNFREGGNGPLS